MKTFGVAPFTCVATSIPNKTNKRPRCSECPRDKDKKASRVCSSCNKPVCPDHSQLQVVCFDCLRDNKWCSSMTFTKMTDRLLRLNFALWLRFEPFEANFSCQWQFIMHKIFLVCYKYMLTCFSVKRIPNILSLFVNYCAKRANINWGHKWPQLVICVCEICW